MHRRNRKSGVTLIEMIVAAGVVGFVLVASLKAITITRSINDRTDVLTRMMLRAHSEIEARKAIPFAKIEVGVTELGGFDDPNTTGVLKIVPLDDSPGVRVVVDLATRTARGAQTIHLSALRFPGMQP